MAAPDVTTDVQEKIDPPLAILAELTHRCPLQCPYCSNPLELARASEELATEEWLRLFDEAAALGALQVHLSGGEPAARKDLAQLVAGARNSGLYTNLITSGLLLDRARIDELIAAGLDHVQLSLQDSEPESADRIAGHAGAHAKKLQLAAVVRAAGLPLTLNVVIHRHNVARLDCLIAMALELGALRMEVAHVQYYGWGLANRAALLPGREIVEAAAAKVEAARRELKGRLVIDHVVPDYHARRPKACMGGWGRRFIAIAPTGRILPCHAAATIPGIDFPHARTHSLAEAWEQSPAFRRYRGTHWMPEPCRSCDRREIDWGGCRCQALALTGDAGAVDPVCELSPDHDVVASLAADIGTGSAEFRYRRFGG